MPRNSAIRIWGSSASAPADRWLTPIKIPGLFLNAPETYDPLKFSGISGSWETKFGPAPASGKAVT